MATSECRIGKTAGGRTARLNYAVIAPRFGPCAIGEVIEDFRSLTPVHTQSSRVFSRRNRAVACISSARCAGESASKFGLMRKTEQQAFPRLPECTTTLGGRVAAGQHSLENLLTCSFRHYAFIFCPKHQRGGLLGCSALEATGS